MNRKISVSVWVGFGVVVLLLAWNHLIGQPYQYGIAAGQIIKSNKNNGQLWKLQSPGWREIGTLGGSVYWH